MDLTRTRIKKEIAGTDTIYTWGENIFALGNYALIEKDSTNKQYSYTFDGSYGNYDVSIHIEDSSIIESCTCPYPHKGCKHIMAACLDISEQQKRQEKIKSNKDELSNYLICGPLPPTILS